MYLIRIECALPSCSMTKEATERAIRKAGWRQLKESKEHMPPMSRWRTHLGWCPTHAEQYGVKDEQQS